jgi:hypothetical protein
MHGVLRQLLPFKKTWTPEQLILASHQYLEQLIDTIYGPGTSSLLIRKRKSSNPDAFFFYGQRSRKILLMLNIYLLLRILIGSAKPFVRKVYEERYKQLVKSLPHLLVDEKQYCFASQGTEDDRDLKFLEAVRDDFDEILNAAASKFKAIKLKGTRDVWLGNFCEQIAFTSTGNVKNVVGYLLDFVNC